MAKKRTTKKVRKTAFILIILIVILLIISGIMLIYKNLIKDNYNKSFGYPTDYEEYVLKYSKEYDIDPRFVFAIIRTESHFNPNATSDVGARGLMQIMEVAYDWIKFRLNDERDNTYDDMYDPELNIEYGTYMLKYLYDEFDGSYELAAAGYHGGMNAVAGWINDGIIDPDDLDINDIPSSDTAHYINKVMNAYNNYKENFEEDYNNGKD